MRKIRLTAHEIRLFSSEIDGQDYQFFRKHGDTFKRMWEDQGREFWERFVICYKAFSINYGVLKEFPLKNEQYEVYIEDAFTFITKDFVKGKVNSAKNVVTDTAALAQQKGSLGGLESNSYSRDPFYHKETRDIFRRFFGDPQEKSSYIKVYLLLPLYLCFGGAVCTCMRIWLEAEVLGSGEEYWIQPSADDLKPKWNKKDKNSTVADLMQLANPDKAYRVVEDKDEEKLILTFLYEQNKRREMGARTFRDLDEYRRHIHEERMDSTGRMSQFVDPKGDGNLIDLSKATEPWWRENTHPDCDKKNKKRKKNKLSAAHKQVARENMAADADKGISVCIGMPKEDMTPKVVEMPTYPEKALIGQYMDGYLPSQYLDLASGTRYINTKLGKSGCPELGAIPKITSSSNRDEQYEMPATQSERRPDRKVSKSDKKSEKIVALKDKKPEKTNNPTDKMSEKKVGSTDKVPEKTSVATDKKADKMGGTTDKIPQRAVTVRKIITEYEDTSPVDTPEKGNPTPEKGNPTPEDKKEEKVVYKKKLKAKRSLPPRPMPPPKESETIATAVPEVKPSTVSQAEQAFDPSMSMITKDMLKGISCSALENMTEEPKENETPAEYLERWKKKHPPGTTPPFTLSPDGKGACLTMKVTLTATEKEDKAASEEDLEGWGRLLRKLEKIQEPRLKKKALDKLATIMTDSPKVMEILEKNQNGSADEDEYADDEVFQDFLLEFEKKKEALEKKVEKDSLFSKKINQLYMPRLQAAVTETFKKYGASVLKVVRPGDPEFDDPVGGTINIDLDESKRKLIEKSALMAKREERIARKRQNKHAYGVPRDKENKKQPSASRQDSEEEDIKTEKSKDQVKVEQRSNDSSKSQYSPKEKQTPAGKEGNQNGLSSTDKEDSKVENFVNLTEKEENGKSEQLTGKELVPKVGSESDGRIEVGDFTVFARNMETGLLMEKRVKLYKVSRDVPRENVEKVLFGVGQLPKKRECTECATGEHSRESCKLTNSVDRKDLVKDGDIIEWVDPVEGSVFKQVVTYDFSKQEPVRDPDIRNMIFEQSQQITEMSTLPKPETNWVDKLETSGAHMKDDGSYTPVRVDAKEFAQWFDHEVQNPGSTDINNKPFVVCVFTEEEERSGTMERVMKQMHEFKQEAQKTGGLSSESLNKLMQSGLKVCGAGVDDVDERKVGLLQRLKMRKELVESREAELGDTEDTFEELEWTEEESKKSYGETAGVDGAASSLTTDGEQRLDSQGEIDKQNGKVKNCFGCGKVEPKPKAFKKCQRCRELNVKQPRYYCGKSCQVRDWTDRHKKEHKDWKKVEEPL